MLWQTPTIRRGHFENSKLPLRVWFFTAFQMQYKVSVRELAKTLGVHYETAFNMVKRLREGLYIQQLQEKLKGIVEMDEVYITAGLKGKRSLHLYCAQYNFLRNTRKEDRTRRAVSMIAIPLTNIEEQPCTISPI